MRAPSSEADSATPSSPLTEISAERPETPTTPRVEEVVDDEAEDPVPPTRWQTPPPPPPTQPVDPTTSLAQAIALLAQSTQSLRGPPSTPTPARTKIREPDTFDGSEPKKLRPFLVQLTLNYQDHPHAFPDDRAKVIYAISYLKGNALAWFEPDLLDSAPGPLGRPLWETSFSAFVDELKLNFGPLDPISDAERRLGNLQMKDGQRIAKYLVEWNGLASLLSDWGDGALRHQFYSGLPPRIKDEIARVGKPSTLEELKRLSQTIDHRYWERRNEVSAEGSSSKGPSSTSKSSSDTRTSSSSTSDKKSGKKGSGTSSRGNSGGSHSHSSGGSSHRSASKSSTPSYADKLGKDGKLTSEERSRRLSEGLCLFCGNSGHVAKDCPKSSSRSAKARSASATTSASSTSAAPANSGSSAPVSTSEAKK